MSTNTYADKGPIHGTAREGFSKAYDEEAEKRRARHEDLSGEVIPSSLSPMKGMDIKDPDHDLESPASMPAENHLSHYQPGGPNTQGNDRESLHQDPEGQQGGTEGGSQGRPLATKAERTTGTLHLHRENIS